jgi:DNA-binding transcriptional LysR family regulator
MSSDAWTEIHISGFDILFFDMTPKQLEVFVQVVQLGSVTAAARALDMSQPSVSKSLALVEQQMGFVLFERGDGKMQPTPEAREVYEEACRVQQSMARFDRFLEQVRHYSVGQLRVCATPALAINVLPQAAKRFREAYPDHGLVVDMYLNNEIEDAIAHRQYDLGFVLQPADGSVSKEEIVSTGRMVCVMPYDHRLASRERVRWQDLNARELVYITTDARIVATMANAIEGFRERSVSALETNRYTMAINLVRQGIGLTLVDEFALVGTNRDGLAVVPFSPQIPVVVKAVRCGRKVVDEQVGLFIHAMRGLLESENASG